ncbi:hypothetical protein TPHA_0A03220 [Tetrapisispora phaffii CBS 4417]|uniref:ATPase inhibitor, mitochondrial n=1 Tax=Tetrapisispora phaffii (strain ATCC 24235 / CBS 4417 / NBRC 1672 / NRRL Y-8282 / UCD 70-5) TaxID=1071381 RepID=G8BNC1_TETPH|nr:hypothetical protein TPHA_0A03220 [Tetrapisispora phaffii CBS 4417]CCE61399.1 hypothetical protein TPHA_0A03220 [Tetrapisispora phaffii CBS 4417]
MLSRSSALKNSVKNIHPLAYIRLYTEGATGAPRSEGGGDSFTKREKANEDYFIRQHEKEQLAELRNQLQKQQKKLDQIESKIEQLSK